MGKKDVLFVILAIGLAVAGIGALLFLVIQSESGIATMLKDAQYHDCLTNQVNRTASEAERLCSPILRGQ